MARARHLMVSLLVVTVVAAGCGGDDDSGDDTTTTATSPTTEVAPPSSEPSSSNPTTEGSTSTSTPGDTVPEADLPGERIDIYPYEGASLAVVGVAADDELNVRAGPGTDFDVLFTLAPLATGAVAQGHNRTVGDDFWVLVESDGRAGWANGAFVAQLGTAHDIAGELPEGIGGETLLGLAENIADARVGDGGPEPDLTVVAGPVVGDTNEITFDVVGYADDAIKGERIHVTADELDAGEAFVPTAVEATPLCARGVADGLCA